MGYLFGFSLDSGSSLKFDEYAKCQSKHWGHFDLDNDATRSYLREQSGLDSLIVDAMIAEETRPRFVQLNNDGCLLILRAINFNESEENENMISVRVWIEDKRVITVSHKKLRAAEDVADMIHRGNGAKTTADFCVSLIKQTLSHIDPILVKLDESTEDLEENLPNESEEQAFNLLSDLKRETLTLRRHLAPERDVIFQLGHASLPFFQRMQSRQVLELHDRISRYVEDLENIRERITSTSEELRSRMAMHMNRTMYMFSLVAVIFLPLTFLTGLFGINVGGIPGSEQPMAFAIFSGIMLFIAVSLVWFFRKIRWF